MRSRTQSWVNLFIYSFTTTHALMHAAEPTNSHFIYFINHPFLHLICDAPIKPQSCALFLFIFLVPWTIVQRFGDPSTCSFIYFPICSTPWRIYLHNSTNQLFIYLFLRIIHSSIHWHANVSMTSFIYLFIYLFVRWGIDPVDHHAVTDRVRRNQCIYLFTYQSLRVTMLTMSVPSSATIHLFIYPPIQQPEDRLIRFLPEYSFIYLFSYSFVMQSWSWFHFYTMTFIYLFIHSRTVLWSSGCT